MTRPGSHGFGALLIARPFAAVKVREAIKLAQW